VALMDEFKDGKSLYEERKRQGELQKFEQHIPEAGKPHLGPRNMKRSKAPPQIICEQWDPGGCKGSQEAVKLGLAQKVFICTGIIMTTCEIRTKLASGMTVQELFNK